MLPCVGSLTDVHSAAKNPLGLRRQEAVGGVYKEYVYLKGVASTVLGSWVVYDELHLTTLTVANALGRVAIALAATVASTWGWYQIFGSASGLCLASYADNAKVWVTSTPGQIDDADVATDLVINAIGRSARSTTTGLATFELSYPVCLNEVYN